ncbi:hypothetical protein [Natronorubrum halophilum]|uniref:hypothetical protein n=1 Tax=Natronorubrum halophilum TaxID=1702106 RepID=UPI0013CF171B|nr:hypothetical protein [Natronorubrum halophilum]
MRESSYGRSFYGVGRAASSFPELIIPFRVQLTTAFIVLSVTVRDDEDSGRILE